MKRTNKSLTMIIFGLVLVLVQTGPVFAQATADSNSTITGHVNDPQGASIPGATVTLYARERAFRVTTATDSTGAYSFEKLAPGEYLIESQAEGFASGIARRVVVERGRAATVDISLELSGVRSTVVITAADTPQSVDEVSKAVTVVNRQEIDERDESAIAESLRAVPGLRIQQLGGPGSFTAIKTRGLRNEEIGRASCRERV